MKFLSIFLSFCFMVNSFSAMARGENLKELMDDYEYALTVEWDQKDKKFFDDQTARFLNQMENMLKDGSLSKVEILEVINQEVLQAPIKRDLVEKINLLNQASPAEMAKIISENATSLYLRGSSWAPSAGMVFGVGVGIVVVLGLIGIALTEARTDCTYSHTDQNYDEHYTCTLSDKQIFN